MLGKALNKLTRNFRVQAAINKARELQKDPDFKQPSEAQKFIEFSSNMHPVSKSGNQEELYGSQQRKAGFLLHLVEEGIRTDGEEVTLQSLERLTHYYGIDRSGGITQSDMEAFEKRNKDATSAGQDPVFSERFMTKLRETYERQQSMPNYERAEKLKEANRTWHERYPSDFLNEVKSDGREAAIAHLLNE